MGMMDEAIPDRYENNPMLAVLENYVLEAIGKLDPDKSKLLNEMICRTFGGTEWRRVIREQFDLPKETDDNLRHLWKRRQGGGGGGAGGFVGGAVFAGSGG